MTNSTEVQFSVLESTGKCKLCHSVQLLGNGLCVHCWDVCSEWLYKDGERNQRLMVGEFDSCAHVSVHWVSECCGAQLRAVVDTTIGPVVGQCRKCYKNCTFEQVCDWCMGAMI